MTEEEIGRAHPDGIGAMPPCCLKPEHHDLLAQLAAMRLRCERMENVVEAVRGKPKVTYTDKDPAALIRYLVDLDFALAAYDSATERKSE